MEFKPAERLTKLPPYLFKELDRLRNEVAARGVDIINLGVGDPDKPTPANVIKRLAQAAENPENHIYPAYSGNVDFKGVAAKWFKGRFGVEVDPDSEMITLIGSKEGIAHWPFAFINPGDVVLVPTPAYPVYNSSTLMAGGIPVEMPLLKENGFLPDLDAISPETLKKAKALVINYPNNPTAACAELDYLSGLVDFCREHELILISDAAYTELAFDGYKPHSVLEVPGAKDVALEFHSLSKTYNMTGWRIAWAVGNKSLVAGLGTIKAQTDSGVFKAIQEAGMEALSGDQAYQREMVAMYQKRRDVLVEGLNGIGLMAEKPKATFYVWCPCPDGVSSSDMCTKLLNETGVVCTPGNGLGSAGEGFVRFALTVGRKRLKEAVDRIAKVDF